MTAGVQPVGFYFDPGQSEAALQRVIAKLDDLDRRLKTGALSTRQYEAALQGTQQQLIANANNLGSGARSQELFDSALGRTSAQLAGAERSAMRFERGMQRAEFATFAMMNTGDLTTGSLRGLSLGFSRMVPAIMPWIGIMIVAYEVLHRWKTANEEAQASADKTRESWDKWQETHAKPFMTPTRTNDQILATQQRALESARRAQQDAIDGAREAQENQQRSIEAGGSGADYTAAIEGLHLTAVQQKAWADQLERTIKLEREALGQQHEEEQRKFVENLEREADRMRFGADAMREYDIASQHLSASYRTRAEQASLLIEVESGLDKIHADTGRLVNRRLDQEQAARDHAQQLHDTRERIRAEIDAVNTADKAGTPHALAKSALAPDKALEASKAQLRETERMNLQAAEVVRRSWDHAFDALFTKGAKGWADFIGGIEKMFEQAAARMAANAMAKAILIPFATSLFGPGFGGALSKAFGFHQGGIAGSGGEPRLAPADAFAGAPRHHAGFMPDEVPAILRRGEGVLTPPQMQAAAAAMAAPSAPSWSGPSHLVIPVTVGGRVVQQLAIDLRRLALRGFRAPGSTANLATPLPVANQPVTARL